MAGESEILGVIPLFGLAAFIIAVGFFGNMFFHRTRFPDTLVLLFIGLLLGPVFGIFPYQVMLDLVPFVTTLALIMVLFYGGLEMSIKEVITKSSRAFLLAALYFAFVTAASALLARQLFGLSWVQSLMLGPMIAGTSSIVIVPLISKLNGAKSGPGALLTVESTVTDVLNIVFFFALLQAYLTTTEVVSATAVQNVFAVITAKFSIGIVAGSIAGIAWVKATDWLYKEEYLSMFTLAVLFFVFTFTEFAKGSGVVAAFVFGLVCGNSREMIRTFRLRLNPRKTTFFNQYLKRFQGELSFLLRAFFFVFIGLLYKPESPDFLFISLVSVLLFVVNLLLRYAAAWIATAGTEMARHRALITLLCGQGLAHAALSVIPLSQGMPNAHIYLIVVVNIILLTNVTTALAPFLFRREFSGEKAAPADEHP